MAAPNTANLVARYLDEANIHQSVAPMIDIAFFNKVPGDDADEVHLNSYTLGRILDYKTLPSCQGLEMLGSFQEDFEGWTADRFKALNQRIRKALRAIVRFRGVYTGRSNGRIDTQLVALLQAE